MNTSTMKSYGDYRHTRDSFPPPNRLRSLAVHNRRRNAQTLSAEELFGTGFAEQKHRRCNALTHSRVRDYLSDDDFCTEVCKSRHGADLKLCGSSVMAIDEI